MSYPKNELAQLLLVSLVAQKVEEVVISPGSRNAPLTIGFVNHPKIKAYSIVDERCAAFVALGMAQQKQTPVALLCTSGSALLNYYPAIAEAFYSEVPLVVISADRPAHLIDIGDGQTIRQNKVFESHSHCNVNLQSSVLEDNAVLVEEALCKARTMKGPVHINVPFEEPLYETVPSLSKWRFKKLPASPVSFEEAPLEIDFLKALANRWNLAAKKIILVGAQYPDESLRVHLNHFSSDPSVLIFTETTSNLVGDSFIAAIDQLLFPLSGSALEALKPEILLTFGGMVVSKRVKEFFRAHPPKEHWHVDPYKPMNTYQCLTQHVQNSASFFLRQFACVTAPKSSTYQLDWNRVKQNRHAKQAAYLKTIPFTDLKVHGLLYESLPENIHLQLGNSSVIRYAQFFETKSSWQIFCNRGTSGIEGSTSTAIGAAMVSKIQTVFFTGDLSFFYDSNALWNAYIPKSFRIVLINNQGGGIFKVIPGPSSSGVSDYFETPHNLGASQLCELHGFHYECVDNEKDLKAVLKGFYQKSEQPKLLEIRTPSDKNDLVLKAYFKNLTKNEQSV